MILTPKPTTEQTYRRGAALSMDHRLALKKLTDVDGMRAVSELAGVTEQTLGKAILGEPLLLCSRKRLAAIVP
jgi:hypothetical protein